MAFVHGKNTVVKLGGVDLSAFADNSEFERLADKHDVTTYGKSSHVYQGGLKDGTFTMSGTYDNTAAGPHDVIAPMLGTTVALVRQCEGVGTGLPQETVDVVVEKYTETSPTNDMVKWACDCQLAGDVVAVNQP